MLCRGVAFLEQVVPLREDFETRDSGWITRRTLFVSGGNFFEQCEVQQVHAVVEWLPLG